MRSYAPRQRRVTTVPLPGDREMVLDVDYRAAVRRDERLTADEMMVKLCTRALLAYGLGFCFLYDCPYCGGIGDSWERMYQAWQRGMIR